MGCESSRPHCTMDLVLLVEAHIYDVLASTAVAGEPVGPVMLLRFLECSGTPFLWSCREVTGLKAWSCVCMCVCVLTALLHGYLSAQLSKA